MSVDNKVYFVPLLYLTTNVCLLKVVIIGGLVRDVGVCLNSLIILQVVFECSAPFVDDLLPIFTIMY